MQLITGNTYPVRDQIKALGGRWLPRLQAWSVPDSAADQARALVASAPASTPPPSRRSSPRVVVARFSSGATITQNARGRCIDAPCCGCCS